MLSLLCHTLHIHLVSCPPPLLSAAYTLLLLLAAVTVVAAAGRMWRALSCRCCRVLKACWPSTM